MYILLLQYTSPRDTSVTRPIGAYVRRCIGMRTADGCNTFLETEVTHLSAEILRQELLTKLTCKRNATVDKLNKQYQLDCSQTQSWINT